MRTLRLAALGAALAMVATTQIAGGMNEGNASRVIQGVITGIGFLGAGVILKDGTSGHVQGLTTAATIWVTACIGIVCGIGAWDVVFTSAALVLILLMLGGFVDKRVHRRWRTREPGRAAQEDTPS